MACTLCCAADVEKGVDAGFKTVHPLTDEEGDSVLGNRRHWRDGVQLGTVAVQVERRAGDLPACLPALPNAFAAADEGGRGLPRTA